MILRIYAITNQQNPSPVIIRYHLVDCILCCVSVPWVAGSLEFLRTLHVHPWYLRLLHLMTVFVAETGEVKSSTRPTNRRVFSDFCTFIAIESTPSTELMPVEIPIRSLFCCH